MKSHICVYFQNLENLHEVSYDEESDKLSTVQDFVFSAPIRERRF